METKTLCFATNNAHKLEEVKSMLPPEIKLVSLKEIGCFEELPENQRTIEGNAIEKARYVFEKYGIDCFADDSGLEVDFLDGAPGVDTAHYAGKERDANKNMDLLLTNLNSARNRKARFKTVFSLFWQGEMYEFSGVASGEIALEKAGENGFGYDPIFVPDGFTKTFAELGTEVKNQMSHRAKATRQLLDFILF
jgi:XTP/dITP diphosphohydrolase